MTLNGTKIFILLMIVFGIACGGAPSAEKPTVRFVGDYLGKAPPGLFAEVFDDGDLTGDTRLFNIAFSPADDELFFSYNKGTPEGTGPDYEIRHLKRVGDEWSEPETAWFSGTYSDCDLTFSPDGHLVFFASELRPHPVTGSQMDICFLEKTEDGWSEPIHIGTEVIHRLRDQTIRGNIS